jgi:hypothetical protein
MQTADCRLPIENADCRLAIEKVDCPLGIDVDRGLAGPRAKVVWGGRLRAALALAGALTLPSCSDAIRTGQSPAYLIITNMTGTKGGGANSGTQATSLPSDVLTRVPAITGPATVFSDSGTASFQLQMKDTLQTPTAVNAITIDQYHVKYIRADGHNVQGVDVPYEFDGAATATISNTGSVSFTLVRVQAKTEAPLAALVNNFQVISTIAEVTFYGHDQNGRAVSVTGRLDVDFSDWGD